MMRFLFISLSGLVLGCATTPLARQQATVAKACIDKFKPSFTSELYKASVDVLGKHISGIMLFKAMPDSSTRIVFTNEAGVKFFDFEFRQDGEFVNHYAIRQLNKKIVVQTLRKDLALAIMQRVGKEIPEAYLENNEMHFVFSGKNETDQIITDKECSKLLRLEKGTAKMKKMEIRLFGQPRNAPDSAIIRHLNFNMVIKLNRLQRL